MVAYLETIAVVLVSILGVFLGRKLARLRSHDWLSGYIVPFVLIGMVALARWVAVLPFAPPFSWIMAGRREFVIMSLALTLMLTTALSRLPHPRQKLMVSLFMVMTVIYFSVLPFLLPVILRARLSDLQTTFDSDAVCLQSTSYTCGPAATVTALRRLEIRAEEGEIAVLSYSNPVTGTPPDLLCAAIQKRFGQRGLSCRYRLFGSIPEMRGELGVAIVGVRFSLMADHYVAVLEVTDGQVVIGDPYVGKRMLTYDEFAKMWRYDGIMLTRINRSTALNNSHDRDLN